MGAPTTKWAVIAEVDAGLLESAAAEAWENFAGGEPPVWRVESTPSGETVLIGDEQGLQGMFDLWALAVHKILQLRVVVLDWNFEFPDVFEADGGALNENTKLAPHKLAKKYGLLDEPIFVPPTTREVLVIESGTLSALLKTMDYDELPPPIRSKETGTGLAVWSIVDGGGLSGYMHELSAIGRCYSVCWGPPPIDFSVLIMESGESIGCLELPGPPNKRYKALEQVLGKSSPNEICEVLGVAEFVSGTPSD